MNIVWAAKLAAGLLAVVALAYVVIGPGLKQVLSPADLRHGWRAVVVTALISCLSLTAGVFCMILAAWSLWLSRSMQAEGQGALYAYALLIVLCPPISLPLDLPGQGMYLLRLTPPRLLALTLLLPLTLRLWNAPRTQAIPAWLRLSDAAVLLFALLSLGRQTDPTVTVVVRTTIETVLDSLLPYYVLSRATVDSVVRTRMLSFFLLGASFQAVVGVMEGLTHHQFYSPLQYLYNVSWQTSLSQSRGDWLRAQAAFVGALPLAVLLLFAGGIWAVLRPTIRSVKYDLVGLVLACGLALTFGRAAWLSAFAMVISWAALRALNGRQYLLLALGLALTLGVAWAQGMGEVVTQFFIGAFGSTGNEAFNILYRKELLDASLALIKQSPWWGVGDVFQQLAYLKQGEGIIDFVNTYLVVTLNVGLVGLVLFLVPFGVTLWMGAKQHQGQAQILGKEAPVWLALTVAIMAMVFTVSPISIIQPLLIWTVALPLARLQEPKLASL
ncbi:MAG: O-antigen ligase family protein [Burkholderiales bacterium]|nr:O-antigen ligase family protein [Burkholderiales bacterium]